MANEGPSTKLRDLWDIYCLAKMRAAAPTADRYDPEELRIATEELAEELAAHYAATPLRRGVTLPTAQDAWH